MPSDTTPDKPNPPVLPTPPDAKPAGVVELLLRDQDELVRQLLDPEKSRIILRNLLLLMLGSFVVFGVVLGTFSAGTQLLLAPLKVVLGIVSAALICFPSLYIFLCLSGIAISPRHSAAVLLALTAICGLLLIGLAPVIWIFTQSTSSVPFMGTLSLVCWGIALYFGTRIFGVIVKLYPNRQKTHIGLWILIFTLVTFQMTTSLRPIVGTAPYVLTAEKKFFLHYWFDCISEG